jgi:hypothetical protein
MHRERILKAVREKKQITYEGKLIKIADLAMETLKARRTWSKDFTNRMKIASTLGSSTQKNYHSNLTEQQKSSMISRN